MSTPEAREPTFPRQYYETLHGDRRLRSSLEGHVLESGR